MQLLIDGIDVTSYIVPSTYPVFDDKLNQTKTLTFSLYPANEQFPLITQGQYVQLVSSIGTVFTGYVTATPVKTIIASGYAGYNVSALSEESVFSSIYTTQLSFNGQFAGDILTSLYNLAKGSGIDTSAVQQGVLVSSFSVQSGSNFASAAYDLCQLIGFRWYILEHKLFLVNQNDSEYGYSVSETDYNYNSKNLSLIQENVPFVNDLSLTGGLEPQTFIQEHQLGDGQTRNFQLYQEPFGNLDNVTLFNDNYYSVSLDTNQWSVIGSGVQYSLGAITVSGSSSYGTNVLYTNSSFELGGELHIDCGDIVFSNLSVGVVGGMYTGSSYTPENCLFGFLLTGSNVTTTITGIVGGNQTGLGITTAANHSYHMEYWISADEEYRYNILYRSNTGQFGGGTITSGCYVTLKVTDTDLSNPLATPVETIIYDSRFENIPSFGVLALVNSCGMFATLSGGVSITKTPSIRVRSNINGRIDGAVLSELSGSYSFSIPSTPQTNEIIEYTFRAAGQINTRIANQNNISMYGLSPYYINNQLIGRMTADYENFAKAYLTDHEFTYFSGSYIDSGISFVQIPQSGRFIDVNVPSITNEFDAIISECAVTVINMETETISLTTTFGFSSPTNSYSGTKSESNIQSVDINSVPEYIDTVSFYQSDSITGTSIAVTADVSLVLGGFEIRNTDSGWGTGNYLETSNTSVFSLPRQTDSDLFYIRQYDTSFDVRYSRYSWLITSFGVPVIPAAPVGPTINVGTNVTYSVTLSNTADVYGVEIRESDGVTVIYSDVYSGPVVYTIANISLTRSYTALFYTFNIRNEYSSGTSATGSLPAPLAPTISLLNQINNSFTIGITVESGINVVQEILEAATDSAFTEIFFTDSRASLFSVSTFNVASDGTYYVRASVSDILGFGPYTSPVFSFVASNTVVINNNTPDIPSGLSVTSSSVTKGNDGTLTAGVSLSWTETNLSIVSGYIVQFALSGTGKFNSVSVPSTSNDLTIDNLSMGVSYDFQICAVGELPGINSDYSSILTYTTPSTSVAPTPPTGLQATATFRGIMVTWNANTDKDLSGYYVQWSSDNATWSVVNTTSSTYFLDNGDAVRGRLEGSTTYYYRVAAFNTTDQISAYTSSVNSTTNLINVGELSANVVTANQIDAGAVTTAKLDASGITVGGAGSKPVLLTAVDGSSNTIAEIGQMTGNGPWNDQYGGWFKNIGIGGSSPSAPTLWIDDSGNLTGTNGSAIDLDGNIKLKNIVSITGYSGGTLSNSYSDLGNLGTGNSSMTVTTKGNPLLIGVNLQFSSISSGGYINGYTITDAGDYTNVNNVVITVTGDGTGGAATPVWFTNNSGASLYLSSVDYSGGVNYTYASATVNGGTYSAQASINLSVATPTPNSGVVMYIQILMDGNVLLEPVQITTDSNGQAQFNILQLYSISAGSHVFEVQAKSTSAVTVGNTLFQLVELG